MSDDVTTLHFHADRHNCRNGEVELSTRCLHQSADTEGGVVRVETVAVTIPIADAHRVSPDLAQVIELGRRPVAALFSPHEEHKEVGINLTRGTVELLHTSGGTIYVEYKKESAYEALDIPLTTGDVKNADELIKAIAKEISTVEGLEVMFPQGTGKSHPKNTAGFEHGSDDFTAADRFPHRVALKYVHATTDKDKMPTSQKVAEGASISSDYIDEGILEDDEAIADKVEKFLYDPPYKLAPTAGILQSTAGHPLLVWASPPALAAAIGFPASREEAGAEGHVLGTDVYAASTPGHFLSSRPLPLVASDGEAMLIPYRGWKDAPRSKDVLKLPPGWESMRPGEKVIISSVQLPDADTDIPMPSLLYTKPGASDLTVQAVDAIPVSDVQGLVAVDVVALLQARFNAETTDIEVLVRLAADSTMEFSERYGRSYTLKWGTESTDNPFWSRKENADALTLAFPNPLGGPAEYNMITTFPPLCRDADGRAAHSTTLYGKPDEQEEAKVLLLFATKEFARRDHITSKCRFLDLVDIGPRASPLYDEVGRVTPPLTIDHLSRKTHQLSWRNRHFVKVASPFAKLLRARSTLGTGSDVALRPARMSPGQPAEQAPPGISMDLRRGNIGPEINVFIASSLPPPPPPTTVYLHFTESAGEDIGVVLAAPLPTQLASGIDKSAASAAEAHRLAFEIPDSTYLELDEPTAYGGHDGVALSFPRPHELQSGDMVHLERAPSSARSPYTVPASPAVPHFFDSHPPGCRRDGRFAAIPAGPKEGAQYRVRKINSSTIVLESPADGYPVDVTAAHTRLALSEDPSAGDAQGSVRIVRHVAASPHNRPWDTAYVEIVGLSGEGRSPLSTDVNMTRTGSLVVPVPWQLGDRLLRPLVSASVRNPDRNAKLRITVAGADGVARPASFPDGAGIHTGHRTDIIRVDVVVTITRTLAAEAQQRYDRLNEIRL